MTAYRPASLPMYDADRAAVQAWWRGVADAMRSAGLADVPDSPSWPADLHAHWHDPTLLLSQTCGYPLVTDLKNMVQVVGVFQYGVPGCSGSAYRSELVVRDEDAAADIADLRGRIAAINDRRSHSGDNALRALVAPLAIDGSFFAGTCETGSHRQSLAAVRSGRADIASIDCVTLAGLQRASPYALEGLRVIGSTSAAPGLPLVTGAHTTREDLARLRSALRRATVDPALASQRAALFIVDYEDADFAHWNVVSDMASAATALGCRDL